MMRIQIVIPKGWRRLRRGRTREGDLYIDWRRDGKMKPVLAWCDTGIGFPIEYYYGVIRRKGAR